MMTIKRMYARAAFVSLLAIAAGLVMTTASCSSENDLTETPNVEQPQVTTNGVQITVGAGFDDASTRSAVVIDGTKHVLTFTDDDKLYVYGDIDENKVIAGYLNMNGAPTNENKSAQFTGNYGTDLKAYSWNGTQYAETSHSFSTADILGECSNVKAVLVDANSTFTVDPTLQSYKMCGTFAGSAPTVDDLMTKGLEVKGDYVSASHSFTLSNNNTIFNCTFSGLTPSTTYKVCQALSNTNFTFYSFTTDANGAGTIAFIADVNSVNNTWYISVCKSNGDEVGDIPLGTRSFESKIYNVSRHWTGSEFVKSLYLPYVKSDVTVADGTMLIGKLAQCKQINIAAGTKVTLNNVDINGDKTFDGKFPGITCEGNATLTLVGTNTVRGCYGTGYPGIFPAKNKTLTINGTGKLFAYGNGSGAAGIGGGKKTYLECGNIRIQSGEITAEANSDNGAGIGTSGLSGYNNKCGTITITGGTVTATGGGSAAGIGTGCANIGSNKTTTTNQCGNISISGGTVTATGGSGAAGIGLGYTFKGKGDESKTVNKCGDITISGSGTRVTAIRGGNSGSGTHYCIGKGAAASQYITLTCGTITIGGVDKGTEGVNPTPDGNTYVYKP